MGPRLLTINKMYLGLRFLFPLQLAILGSGEVVELGRGRDELGQCLRIFQRGNCVSKCHQLSQPAIFAKMCTAHKLDIVDCLQRRFPECAVAAVPTRDPSLAVCHEVMILRGSICVNECDHLSKSFNINCRPYGWDLVTCVINVSPICGTIGSVLIPTDKYKCHKTMETISKFCYENCDKVSSEFDLLCAPYNWDLTSCVQYRFPICVKSEGAPNLEEEAKCALSMNRFGDLCEDECHRLANRFAYHEKCAPYNWNLFDCVVNRHPKCLPDEKRPGPKEPIECKSIMTSAHGKICQFACAKLAVPSSFHRLCAPYEWDLATCVVKRFPTCELPEGVPSAVEQAQCIGSVDGTYCREECAKISHPNLFSKMCIPNKWPLYECVINTHPVCKPPAGVPQIEDKWRCRRLKGSQCRAECERLGTPQNFAEYCAPYNWDLDDCVVRLHPECDFGTHPVSIPTPDIDGCIQLMIGEYCQGECLKFGDEGTFKSECIPHNWDVTECVYRHHPTCPYSSPKSVGQYSSPKSIDGYESPSAIVQAKCVGSMSRLGDYCQDQCAKLSQLSEYALYCRGRELMKCVVHLNPECAVSGSA